MSLVDRKHVRRALPVLALLLALAFLGRRVFLPGDGGTRSAGAIFDEAPAVAPETAAERVGRPTVVCGRVQQARRLPGVEGDPTFLNFGGSYPNQAFTAVVWGRYRGRFDIAPADAYRNARICVAGIVRSHEGTPQIEVRRPEQIRVRGRPGLEAPAPPG